MKSVDKQVAKNTLDSSVQSQQQKNQAQMLMQSQSLLESRSGSQTFQHLSGPINTNQSSSQHHNQQRVQQQHHQHTTSSYHQQLNQPNSFSLGDSFKYGSYQEDQTLPQKQNTIYQSQSQGERKKGNKGQQQTSFGQSSSQVKNLISQRNQERTFQDSQQKLLQHKQQYQQEQEQVVVPSPYQDSLFTEQSIHYQNYQSYESDNQKEQSMHKSNTPRCEEDLRDLKFNNSKSFKDNNIQDELQKSNLQRHEQTSQNQPSNQVEQISMVASPSSSIFSSSANQFNLGQDYDNFVQQDINSQRVFKPAVIGSKRSAFTIYKNRNQNEKQTDQKVEETKVQMKVPDSISSANPHEDDVEDSVFSISENIKKMLLETDSKPSTAQGVKQPEHQTSNFSQKSGSQKKSLRPESNALMRLTLRLVDTLQICNPRFYYQPNMNPKRDLTQPSEGVLNNGYDNVDSDYILRVSDSIVNPEGKEYEIMDLMGKGTFGQVVKCECRQTKEMTAIKVIKNKKAFKNQGVIEIKILDILNRVYDPNGESPIVRMLDFFVFRDHLCIVFELLSVSLYELLKENQFQGISLNFSRLIISQILEAMKVVKEARLIHCDLKPENILLKTKDNLNIKVIDLGSACFEGFAIFQYIQSRYYRSPEVLMGLPYDSAIDMWSLGCICAELFLGIPIFPGNSEYDQLARIIEILGPPPQNLIQKAKFRDKYFIFQPEYGFYRFKTLEEFQITTGIRIEIPKKYYDISSLDDLKNLFIMKRREQLMHQGSRSQEPNPSELNTMDAFIDFLKGILRIDKDIRWTPSMAMNHPFITRETFTGHYEPVREQERISTNETGEDTMSEQSSSSRDSKEYRVGSCPSKILYPQTASLPQYLQSQHQPSFQQTQAFNNQSFGQQMSGVSGQEYVFHGTNPQIQSHRPPILSIPDEYFKGFMFGRLDQILSMTRDQLLQFIYEQNELIWRQQTQKLLMFQQQQQFLQQQNQMQFHNPGSMMVPGPMGQPIGGNMMMGFHQSQMVQQFQSHQPNLRMNPGSFQQNQFNPNQPQQIFPGQLPGPIFDQSNQGPQQYQGQPQIGVGGVFIQGIPPSSHLMNPQYPPQHMNYMQQIPQPMMMPPEQIIFNPPPYQQQKQQLFLNAAQLNDPQYQSMLFQQQQRKNQVFKGPRQGGSGGQGGNNKGKAGSWHPPPGLQAHKYNVYYNQINNPGQLIGRQTSEQQQQFIHAQQHQTNYRQHHHHHHQQRDKGHVDIGFGSAASGSFNKSDFRQGIMEKKRQKLPHTVIEEEPVVDKKYGSGDQHVPFPQSNSIFMNFPDPKKKSSDSLFPQQTSFEQQILNKERAQQQNFMMQQIAQQQLDQQYQQMTGGLNSSQQQRQFPSPKFQQNQQQNFMINAKMNPGQSFAGGQQVNQKFISQQFVPNNFTGPSKLGQAGNFGNQFSSQIPSQLQQQQQMLSHQTQKYLSNQQNLNISSSELNQSQSSSFLNNSSSQTSFHSTGGGTSTSGNFLKKFEQNAANQSKQSWSHQNQPDKKLFNQSHYYQYQKHKLGHSASNSSFTSTGGGAGGGGGGPMAGQLGPGNQLMDTSSLTFDDSPRHQKRVEKQHQQQVQQHFQPQPKQSQHLQKKQSQSSNTAAGNATNRHLTPIDENRLEEQNLYQTYDDEKDFNNDYDPYGEDNKSERSNSSSRSHSKYSSSAYSNDGNY